MTQDDPQQVGAERQCSHPQLAWAEPREGDWPQYRSQFAWKIGERLRCTSCNEVLTVVLESEADRARLRTAEAALRRIAAHCDPKHPDWTKDHYGIAALAATALTQKEAK